MLACQNLASQRALRNRIRLILRFGALGLGALSVVPAVQAGDVERTAPLEIPQQSLGSALTSLANQADLQILFSQELVAEMLSAALSGNYSGTEALRRLLANSNLEYVVDGRDTIVIRARSAPALRRTSEVTHPAGAPIRLAQAAPAPQEKATAVLEEVVVTAQFRAENLQETPIAITALSAESLEARSMNRITDISDSAPNVVMKPANGPYGPAAQVFIRGVGQHDSSFALEPGVGVYVDDVYRGVVFGGVLDLLDLDRVEILRGPQGTLAGKNSIGGAVKLHTRKPNGDGSGHVEVTAGDFSRLDLKAGADFAILPDRLFARLSAVNRHRDGYLTRYDYACLNPGSGVPTAVAGAHDCKLGTDGGQDYTAGRLALRWLARSDLEINIAVNRLDEDSEPLPNKLVALSLIPPAAGALQGTDPSIFTTGPEEYTNYSSDTVLPFTDPARYAGEPGAGSHAAVAMRSGVRLNSEDYAATIDWTLGPSLALKSITAYQEIEGDYTNDGDTTPYTVNQNNFYNGHRQFTQELRLNGDILGGALDWTLGAYYYDATSRIKGVNYLLPGLAIENLNSPNDTIATESRSGFAHAVWHITDLLHLTGGLRYTDDEKSYQYQRLNPFVAGTPTYTAAGVLTGTRSVYAGDRWDYRLNVSYEWTAELMTYAQYSTGYRGGGVNPRPFVPEQAVSFNPETLDAYEIGMKSDFFDNRMRLNLSVFFNEYQEIIFTNSAPTPNSLQNATPTNAGDAEITGAEIELTLRPAGGLMIDASASWLDFQLKRIGAAGATISGITLDNVAPFNPEYKASLGLQYEIDLGGAGTLTPRVDGSYQDEFFTNIDNNPLGRVDSYKVYNARLTWRSLDEDWQASLAVTNLTDEFYYHNKLRVPIGVTTGQPALPRQWTVSVRRSF